MEGLEKSYGKLHVLRGVDFDVARGTIFALLGSNGAGKTTIVNIQEFSRTVPRPLRVIPDAIRAEPRVR